MVFESRLHFLENGHLSLHGIDLADLCERHGTPLFLFDEERLRHNYLKFRDAFQARDCETVVCYSVKTNNNLAICKLMEQLGAYAEIISELDLHVASEAGFTADRIILDGPYKPEPLLREALDRKILFINIESLLELQRLDQIAGELGLEPSVGLRVNFFRSRFFSTEGVYCNRSSRFGFSSQEAYSILRQRSKFKNVEISGLMTHPFYDFQKLISFAETAHSELGVEIRYLNFGGGFDPGTAGTITFRELFQDYLKQKLGFKSNLDKNTSAPNIEHIGRSVMSAIEHAKLPPKVTAVFEPGRFVVSDTGFLLLRVDHVKQAGGFIWAIVDGGTNLLPITSERREVQIVNRKTGLPDELVNIVGPIPSLNDFISIKKYLPKVLEGDILMVFDAGAYSLSSSNQFLYPRPTVMMISPEKGAIKIRRKETCEDLLHFDKIS